MCLKFQTKQKNAYMFTRFSILLRNPRTSLSIALHKQKACDSPAFIQCSPSKEALWMLLASATIPFRFDQRCHTSPKSYY